jgi:hypothetical protein
MTFKTILAAAALTLSSAVAGVACPAHDHQAMSCIEGTTWDADAKACVPQISS